MPQSVILPMSAHCLVSELGPVQLHGGQGPTFQMETICKKLQPQQIQRERPSFETTTCFTFICKAKCCCNNGELSLQHILCHGDTAPSAPWDGAQYPNFQTLPVGFILYNSQVCCTKAESAFLFISLAEV